MAVDRYKRAIYLFVICFLQMDLKTELEQRGFLHQYTHEEIFELYEKGGEKFYRGVDLSRDSMTIGNFCAMMQAFHIMRRGNKAYLLVGGATSTIGNPSGKDAERPMLTLEELAQNQEGIHKQFQHLTQRAAEVTGQPMDFTIVNNYDFFKDMNVLEYMREVGKYMTVNWMIGKDIVRRRITDPDKSISYAEFSYMLIMGYDFFRLFTDEEVKLQIGGSDERDGILAGIELIHKKSHKTAYGLTNKLVLDSTGKKFGKSEGNAIWLDPTKNSPYYVYQYLLNIPDADVERFLKLFTFYSFDEIKEIVETHAKDPSQRHGQKKLASYILRLIFDDKAAEQAATITDMLFGASDPLEIMRSMDESDIKALSQATGGAFLETGTYRVLELCVTSGLCASNGEAKKLIKSGALSLNEEKVTDMGQEVSGADAINGLFLLRKGKKNYKSVLFV